MGELRHELRDLLPEGRGSASAPHPPHDRLQLDRPLRQPLQRLAQEVAGQIHDLARRGDARQATDVAAIAGKQLADVPRDTGCGS